MITHRTSQFGLLLAIISLVTQYLASGAARPPTGAANHSLPARVLEAQQIIIVDAQGRKQMELTGTAISLFDGESKMRAKFAVGQNDVSIKLFGKDEEPHCSLIVTEKGAGSIIIGSDQTDLAVLRPNSSAYYNEGKRRLELTTKDQYPRLVVSDRRGNSRAILGHIDIPGEESLANLEFGDSKGARRLLVGGAPTSGSIKGFDEGGKKTWSVP